jgi:hypothetical protein
MNREEELKIAAALNEAIWLRDNAENLDTAGLFKAIKLLGEYKVFSSRQISAIVNGLVAHATISNLIDKKDKTGGKLNPGTLEILRNALYTRATKPTDYKLIEEAISMGTSQGMISKLTGINQSSISRRLKNGIKHLRQETKI